LKRAGGLIRLAILALSGLIIPAAVTAAPPDPRRERVEFDPQTGQWVAIAKPVPGTPEGEFQIARQHLADEEFRAARRVLERWIKKYGPSHELYPQVRLRRAEAILGQKDYYRAHKYLKEFLSEFGGSDLAEDAVSDEFVIAESFLAGKKRRFLGFIPLPAEDIGLRILDDLSSNYPESTIAEKAIKTKADYYYRTGDFGLAEDEYARLQREFPRSQYLPFAMRRSADAALASFNGIPFDDAPLIEAQERYTQYLAQFPAYGQHYGVSLLLDQIYEQRAAKELSIGEYYQRVKQLRAASFYYRSTRDNWPKSLAAIQATEHLRRLGVLDEAEETAPEAAAVTRLDGR
jgi:outer membrane protein assembly factor BamD (BamD/ComL family)